MFFDGGGTAPSSGWWDNDGASYARAAGDAAFDSPDGFDIRVDFTPSDLAGTEGVFCRGGSVFSSGFKNS